MGIGRSGVRWKVTSGASVRGFSEWGREGGREVRVLGVGGEGRLGMGRGLGCVGEEGVPMG